ncbi:hypothetical protein AR687_18190 [Flavobacteriaceae bacterium CRH]|nr:hypothetical protein AR687_18190 [Flavobacteriaceae bacterium CRH]
MIYKINETEDKAIDLIESYNKKILAFDFNSITDDLLRGKLGVIIYLLSLYETTNDTVYVDKIAELLESIFENCDTQAENSLYSNATLSYGITGLGYVLTILMEFGILDENFKQQIDTISEIVYEKALKMVSENNFGYFNGSIGILFYLITVNDAQKIDNIIDLLFERCKNDEFLFYTEMDDSYVEGMNFGLNHGHLALIQTLLTISESNSKALFIINSCLKNINSNLDYDYKVEHTHIFKPYKIFFKENALVRHQNNRLCWCNSDLSFSYILQRTGMLLKNPVNLSLSEIIGKETTKRKTFKTTGIENHHFCHGSSGVAQLYKELSLLDPEEYYEESYNYWIDRTLVYMSIDNNDDLTSSDLSLLYGKLGTLMVINNKIDKKKYLNFLI